MKYTKLLRNAITHLTALLLGGAIVFGGIKVLSTEAKPDSALMQVNARETTQVVARTIPTQSPQSFVATAVARTGPAVVRIDTERIVRRPSAAYPFYEGDSFFEQQWKFQEPPETLEGIGSGFIIDKSGIILTNAHVVDKADKVTVILKDGRKFEGHVKGTDELTDLAVVKINPERQKLPVAPLGNSSDLRVGDWAIAVGNPVGLNNTVTLGIISTLDRSSDDAGIRDKRIDFLQTDAAINPGNSGGPLLNSQGEVIGINTAIRTDARGIGFAIPINKAKSFKDILAAGKQVPHPFVGIQMRDITPELAREVNQDPNSSIILPEIEGVLVVGVLQDTPAEKAGIRRGDTIIRVSNQRITKGSQIQKIVEKRGVNQNLNFEIRRGDRTIELTVRTAQLETNS